MEMEIKQTPRVRADYRNAYQLTADEKQISFMNRYFIFQKVRHVNASKLMPLMEIEPDEPEKPGAKAPEPEPEENKAPEKVIIRKKKVKGGKIVIG